VPAVPLKDQRLDRQHQGLGAQDERVHDADRIDHVQIEAVKEAEILFLQPVVVVRVGIGDAARARRHAV
jgi:hypothetical protein